jgi:hypothetical protein
MSWDDLFSEEKEDGEVKKSEIDEEEDEEIDKMLEDLEKEELKKRNVEKEVKKETIKKQKRKIQDSTIKKPRKKTEFVKQVEKLERTDGEPEVKTGPTKIEGPLCAKCGNVVKDDVKVRSSDGNYYHYLCLKYKNLINPEMLAKLS